MVISGIVCEYNPFHNGHLYHINETRKAGGDYIVAVMSGNFVQRGECAVADKWLRAKAAVIEGADLVIDLPTPWSMSSAETFARGSVGLLMNLGIDNLSFGCESDDKALLLKCAESTDDDSVGEILRLEMSKGNTYPAAMYKAVADVYGTECAKLIASPNNTLAVEYIKQLRAYGKEDAFLPIKREGASHDSSTAKENIASASMLRENNLDESVKNFLPESSYNLLLDAKKQGYAPCKVINCERAIISTLRKMTKSEMENYVSDDSGLLSRIYDAAKMANSIEDLYDRTKCKNYTMSRVRREVMNVYLGIKSEWCEGVPPYIKVLAANEKGLTLLSKAKKNTSLPIITKHAEGEKLTGKAREIYFAECRNTNLFSLMSKKIRACHLEETHSIIIVK